MEILKLTLQEVNRHISQIQDLLEKPEDDLTAKDFLQLGKNLARCDVLIESAIKWSIAYTHEKHNPIPGIEGLNEKNTFIALSLVALLIEFDREKQRYVLKEVAKKYGIQIEGLTDGNEG